MTSAALVTIVVPGRDIAAFAPAALTSLQAQTEQRWQAVLVDDDSRDDTAEIFADAARHDSRFRLIRHPEPRGLGAARNSGLRDVDTPLLGFLDADDEFTPDALSRLTATLEHSESDFVAGAYVRSRLRDGTYQRGRVQPWVAAATDPARIGTTISEHPAASANIVAWSKVYRTDFWGARRFPENVAYEDQVLAQELYVSARSFDVIPDVVVAWRLRADGTSITQGKAQLSVLHDYLAALGGGLDVLAAAGAHATVQERIGLILSMDIPPLDAIAATHHDPEYRRVLDAFVRDLAARPEFAGAVVNPKLREALDW